MFQSIIGDLLITLIISSVWIIIFVLLKKTIFKRYTRSFNYLIWLFIVIRMLCPIKITIDISSYINLSKESPNLLYNLINHIEEMGKSIKSVGSIKAVSFIWISGIIILGIYRGIRYFIIKNKVLSCSYKEDDKAILDRFNLLVKEMGIHKKITLLRADTDSVPFGIGVLSSYIILPKYKFDTCEIEWILKHELTHLKYNDTFYKFLLMVVSTIYWFNPLVYYMNNIINDECELSCDERVLKNCDTKQRQDYALAILKSVKRFKESEIKGVTALGKECFVKIRVENMFQSNFKKGIFVVVLLLLFLFMSVINISINESKSIRENTVQKQFIQNENN